MHQRDMEGRLDAARLLKMAIHFRLFGREPAKDFVKDGYYFGRRDLDSEVFKFGRFGL